MASCALGQVPVFIRTFMSNANTCTEGYTIQDFERRRLKYVFDSTKIGIWRPWHRVQCDEKGTAVARKHSNNLSSIKRNFYPRQLVCMVCLMEHHNSSKAEVVLGSPPGQTALSLWYIHQSAVSPAIPCLYVSVFLYPRLVKLLNRLFIGAQLSDASHLPMPSLMYDSIVCEGSLRAGNGTQPATPKGGAYLETQSQPRTAPAAQPVVHIEDCSDDRRSGPHSSCR